MFWRLYSLFEKQQHITTTLNNKAIAQQRPGKHPQHTSIIEATFGSLFSTETVNI